MPRPAPLLTHSPLLLQVLFNLVPLYGVMVESWPLFTVIYLYWLETLILALFAAARILAAAKPHPENTRTIRLKTAGRYLFIRLGILLFYLLFIVVFVGVMASENDDMLHNVKSVLFMEPAFNIAVMLFATGQGLDLWYFYFANQARHQSMPADYAGWLDARTIVLHVVIVLGAVGYEWVKKKFPVQNHLPLLWYISVFVLVKTIADLVMYRMSSNQRKPGYSGES